MAFLIGGGLGWLCSTGSTTNSSGIRPITEASTCSTFRRRTFGGPTLSSTTSKVKGGRPVAVAINVVVVVVVVAAAPTAISR